MAIQPKTPGIHHINLRSSNLEASKKFYSEVLGFPIALEAPGIFAFAIGGVFIVFKPAGEDAKFNPFTIGTDHIAMACETQEELYRVTDGLQAAGVENTGVKLDETLQKQYVAFKDPDRIQWEFYMI
ncbi:MAG: VOC family protein [Chitinophagaceae bacterium]